MFRMEILIFVLIFIYIIGNIISQFFAPNVPTYEVRIGSIIDDNSYEGIVIRDETVFYSSGSGYLYYQFPETSKVRVNSGIYGISATELSQNTVINTTENFELPSVTQEEIASEINNFNYTFQENEFYEIYSFKDELNYIIGTASFSNETDAGELPTYFEASELSTTNLDGILAYTIDGYEEVTESTLSAEHFDKTNYQTKNIQNGSEIQSGDPAFKVITDEEWSVYILLSEEQFTLLGDTERIDVKFKKDNKIMTGDFSTLKNGEERFGKITFDTGLVRYANERYLEIQLVLDDEQGLKLPLTSVTEESFYEIPVDLLSEDGNSVYLFNEENKYSSELSAKIYNKSEEYFYLSTDIIPPGSILTHNNGGEPFTVNTTKEFDVVYINNKGYTEMVTVDILTQSEEYCIVMQGSTRLRNYDYIALYADTLSDGELTF